MFKDYMKTMGYIALTILLLAALGGLLNVVGVFGERVVFENSFQYKEGMDQRARVLQAQIAEIDANIIKYPEQAQALRAQRKVLEIQLQGTK
jgi:hypothetical protein